MQHMKIAEYEILAKGLPPHSITGKSRRDFNYLLRDQNRANGKTLTSEAEAVPDRHCQGSNLREKPLQRFSQTVLNPTDSILTFLESRCSDRYGSHMR